MGLKYNVLRIGLASTSNSGGQSSTWYDVSRFKGIPIVQIVQSNASTGMSCTLVVAGSLETGATFTGVLAVRLGSAAVASTTDQTTILLSSYGGTNADTDFFPYRFIQLQATTVTQGQPAILVGGWADDELA